MEATAPFGAQEAAVAEPVSIKILDLPVGGHGAQARAARIERRTQELVAALEESFPGQTTVEYFNLREHPGERGCLAGQLLLAGRFPAPVVVVDGEVRIAGNVHVRLIVKAVGRVLLRRPPA